MHKAPATAWFGRVVVCSLTLACEEAVFVIQTRDFQATMEQPYCCAEAHPYDIDRIDKYIHTSICQKVKKML